MSMSQQQQPVGEEQDAWIDRLWRALRVGFGGGSKGSEAAEVLRLLKTKGFHTPPSLQDDRQVLLNLGKYIGYPKFNTK